MDNDINYKPQKKYAVLIDADNVSPDRFERIFDEIGAFGLATYRRIYGNWGDQSKLAHKDKLVQFALTPVQQFANIAGKNATDFAMVIDAMDILYTGNVDGFCIVSNDSDFTRLALRLRESGKDVIGMGDDVAPQAFRYACSLFIVLKESRKEAEELREMKRQMRLSRMARKATYVSEPENDILTQDNTFDVVNDFGHDAPAPTSDGLSDRELRDEIKMVMTTRAPEDGWMSANGLVNELKKDHPGLNIHDFEGLPLFAGKRKIWSTYFLSLGFCEHREIRKGEFRFKIKAEEAQKYLDEHKAQEPAPEQKPAPVQANEPAQEEPKPGKRRAPRKKKPAAEAPAEPAPVSEPIPAAEPVQANEPVQEEAKPKKKRASRKKKAVSETPADETTTE